MQQEKANGLDYSPGSSRRFSYFNDKKAVINYLKKANAKAIKIVIERTDVDSRLCEICYSNELNNVWEAILRDPSKLDLKFNIPALSPITWLRPFDQIKGLYLYAKACSIYINKDRNNYIKKWHLMSKARESGSIHAFFYMNSYNIMELNKVVPGGRQDKVTPDLILEQAKTFANLYGTPGFIILSYDCVHIAKYHLRINDNKQAADAAYRLALQFAYMAKYLEPYCQAAIHNAYFGKGVVASNVFGLRTVDDIIMQCRIQAGHFISDKDDMNIKGNALRAMKIFKGKYHISSESGENTLMEPATFSI